MLYKISADRFNKDSLISVTAITIALMVSHVHCRVLATHTHCIPLPQVEHPAGMVTAFSHAGWRQCFDLELHTISVGNKQ